MDIVVSKRLLEQILSEVMAYNGSAATGNFDSLRAVDAKVKEAGHVLRSLPGDTNSLISAFEHDVDFQANSRRVRLEALANHIKTALRFLDTGAIKEKKNYLKHLTKFPSLQ